MVNHGYERKYTLTDFGWQVYLRHRLIMRHSTGDRHAERLGHLKPAPAGWESLDQQERRS